MLGMLLLRLDEPARIEPFRTRQLRCDDGGKALAVTYNRIGCLLRQVFNQVNTLEDVLQFVQQLSHLTLQRHLGLACRNHLLYHFHMAVDNLTKLILVRSITGCRHFRGIDQLVRNAAQRGNHYY